MAWTFYNSNGESLVQHAESEATQAEMEAETAGVKFVPPDLVKNSPGVAKAWCLWSKVGTHAITASYNMSSVTDGSAAGDTDLLVATDFSSGSYVVVCGDEDGTFGQIQGSSLAAGGFTHYTSGHAGANFDTPNAMIAVFGDQ
jgi:hypothetical protein